MWGRFPLPQPRNLPAKGVHVQIIPVYSLCGNGISNYVICRRVLWTIRHTIYWYFTFCTIRTKNGEAFCVVFRSSSYNHIRSFQNFHYHPKFLTWSQILFQTKSLHGQSLTLNIFQTYLSVQDSDYKSNIIQETRLWSAQCEVVIALSRWSRWPSSTWWHSFNCWRHCPENCYQDLWGKRQRSIWQDCFQTAESWPSKSYAWERTKFVQFGTC